MIRSSLACSYRAFEGVAQAWTVGGGVDGLEADFHRLSFHCDEIVFLIQIITQKFCVELNFLICFSGSASLEEGLCDGFCIERFLPWVKVER